MSLLTMGCVIFPINPFCSGRGGAAAPAMMSASSRCAAIATSLPATSLPRPPEWSGWAWVMTTLPICSGTSPRVSSPCSIGPELPQSPASTNSTSPFSTRMVTLAPMARIWNTPAGDCYRPAEYHKSRLRRLDRMGRVIETADLEVSDATSRIKEHRERRVMLDNAETIATFA